MSVVYRQSGIWKNTLLLGALLLFLSLITTLVVFTPRTHAAPGKINYQGRLTNASGTPMADGQYNMKFRIYSVSTGGTALWTETRETTNRVTVTNGQFNVQLGAVTTIPDSVFATDNTFFEVELPTPATATCATANCGTYTEGAMTPRQPVSSAAYALQANNATTVGGIASGSLARNDVANTFATNNTFNGSITVGSTNSATKFVINDNLSSPLFIADTDTMIVKVGTSTSASLANVRLLTTSAEFTGSVRVGTATNGIDFSGASGIALSGTARPTRMVTLDPEYAGATFRGDESGNLGSLSSDFCSNTINLLIDTTACPTSGDVYNYYQWTTSESTTQDYDIYVRYKLPSDYSVGSMANLGIYAQSTNSVSNVNLYMYDNAGTLCATVLNDSHNNVPSWRQTVAASPIGSCTSLAAGSHVTFKVRMFAGTNNSSRAGNISFEYKAKF